MPRSRFSGEQVIALIKETEAGVEVHERCRRHDTKSGTLYAWRKKLVGMEASDAEKLRDFEAGARRPEADRRRPDARHVGGMELLQR